MDKFYLDSSEKRLEFGDKLYIPIDFTSLANKYDDPFDDIVDGTNHTLSICS